MRNAAPHPSVPGFPWIGCAGAYFWSNGGKGRGGSSSQSSLPSSILPLLFRACEYVKRFDVGDDAHLRPAGLQGKSNPRPPSPRKRGVDPGTLSLGVPSPSTGVIALKAGVSMVRDEPKPYPFLEAGLRASSELEISPGMRFLTCSGPSMWSLVSTLRKWTGGGGGRGVGSKAGKGTGRGRQGSNGGARWAVFSCSALPRKEPSPKSRS